jgi:nicotinate phosphoribosyltransferase
MLQVYLDESMTAEAVFSLSVRRLPARRPFLIACGLAAVLDYLEQVRFTNEDCAYLASLGMFSGRLLDWLAAFRFTGDVHAVPEGTPVFADEPILEIVAPLPQGQIVETFIMNQIHTQTLLASKAWCVTAAAAGRPVVDFGSRRAHGTDAALLAARACYIGGVSATSNVLAGRLYGVPLAGTMAHSYIQAHADEAAAFRAFTRAYPETVLLVDTYDTLEGIRRVIGLASELGSSFRVQAVRIDSGDLVALSRAARRELDRAGLQRVGIFASGGLDEESIARLVAAGAPIDGYGVGTNMVVSSDAPCLDIAYKLCQYAGRGQLKLSAGKPVLPGRKQVYRMSHHDGAGGDVIARAEEQHPGRPLLAPVMRAGRRLLPDDSSDCTAARERARREIAGLPESVRTIAGAGPPYPVTISPALSAYQRETRDRVSARRSG